jgi:23S rRNA pseudouridine1911/1915/1917 synthase
VQTCVCGVVMMAGWSRDPAILFEDDDLLVAVKPPGLPTANAPRGQESLFTQLSRRAGPGGFIGIVSRLDAPVSGVVVVAKTPAAAAGLSQQFRDRSVEKRYDAVVTGRFPAPLGAWVEWRDDLPVHDPDASGSRRRGRGGPPPAATRAAHVQCRVVTRAGEVSLVELTPTTGRRHQLRLQLASRGCPIVGDRRYGSRLPYDGGIALHAREIAFAHPEGGERLRLTAPVPAAWSTRFPMLFNRRSAE